MKLARVIGTIVCTVKHEGIRDAKILMVQPLNDDLKDAGGAFAAIDTVQAGVGDLVQLTMSRESTLALPNSFTPVDAAITGIVDDVHQEDVGILNKEEIFG